MCNKNIRISTTKVKILKNKNVLMVGNPCITFYVLLFTG